jgi:hypothetical protein
LSLEIIWFWIGENIFMSIDYSKKTIFPYISKNILQPEKNLLY